MALGQGFPHPVEYVGVETQSVQQRGELLLEYFLYKCVGRGVTLDESAQTFLVELDFAWPGNARHLEHMAARLALEPLDDRVGYEDIRRVLDSTTKDSSKVQPKRLDLDLGLPALLAESERNWLIESLARYPNLTRAQLAEKLKISRAALYKKLRAYRLGD